MQRIHFTVADLARFRLGLTVGTVIETVFALRQLGGGRAVVHHDWQATIAARLRAHPELDGWVRATATGPPEDLLRLTGQSTASGGGRRPRVPTKQLLELCQLAIVPFWPRIIPYLQMEHGHRGRIAATRGVEHLLSTLHPRVRWTPPVLEIPGGHAADLHLRGRGLQLTAALFLTHRPAVLISEDDTDQPVLAYAAPPPADLLWQDTDGAADALAALVGPTRASALQVLIETCTTSELAARLGISLPGASQHTAVLRSAGLITTRRHRNTAQHVITPLGMALLGGPSQLHPAMTGV